MHSKKTQVRLGNFSLIFFSFMPKSILSMPIPHYNCWIYPTVVGKKIREKFPNLTCVFLLRIVYIIDFVGGGGGGGGGIPGSLTCNESL